MVLDDGFENLSSNIVAAPDGLPTGTIVSGWRVEAGTVDVQDIGRGYPPDTGIWSLDINGYNAGRIATNLITEAGVNYQLTFSFKLNPNLGVGASAQATVTADDGIAPTRSAARTTCTPACRPSVAIDWKSS